MNRLIFLLFLLPIFGISQTGTADGTFTSGITSSGIGIITTAIQSDGKILIGGGPFYSNSATRNGIARLNADGSFDLSFNSVSIGLSTGSSDYVDAIVVQANGKILVGGSFTSYNGVAYHDLLRLNSDGSIDAGFNTGGSGLIGKINSIILQPDGKIVITGYFTSYNGVSVYKIARLNSDGTLDVSFNAGGGGPTSPGNNSRINTMALQSDGKIIISGAFLSYKGIACGNIARINANGSLDTTFNTSGAGFSGFGGAELYSSFIQQDGKILIAGEFQSYNGVSISGFVRLNTDGSLDTAFSNGNAGYNTVRAIVQQADGKIFIGGTFLIYSGISQKWIALLNNDGTLIGNFVSGFNTALSNPTYGKVSNINIKNNGKILICGVFDNYGEAIQRNIVQLSANLLNIEEIPSDKINIYVDSDLALNINVGNQIINKIAIFDITGKLIMTQVDNKKIDLNSFSKGVYILKAVTSTNSFSEKFVVK